MALSNKAIAIIIVAIIAVAGVAAYVLLTAEDTSWQKNITGRLEVYGNANGDDHIDNDDVKALNSFIKSGWDEEKYPFADANQDGKITQADVDMVQGIIDGKTTNVYYINGNGDLKTCKYPVTGLVVGGTAVHPVINATGAYKEAVALTGKSGSVDETLNKNTYNLPSVGSKAYLIDIEALSKYKVDAVFTLNTSVYDDIEEALSKTNISCIRINPDDTDKSLQTFLLVGFLTKHTDQVDKIVSFYDKYMDTIEKNVKKIKTQKTTVTMYSYSMCGVNYYLTKNTVSAGAKNLSDFTDNTKKIKDNPEWAAEDKYQAEYIIQFTGMDFYWAPTKEEMKEEFEYYGQYYTLMKTYPNKYVVFNKDLPDIARIALVANYLYPEEFGSTFAKDLITEMVKVFYPYIEDFDYGKMCNVITYDMAY
jgi:ABC-type Fe3+-hydroxamate transport system substrate-binding protein